MSHRKTLAAAVAVTLAVTPAATLAGDAFVGGLVGGIIGGAIANSQKPKTRTVYRTAKPTVSSSQRQANRDMQTALNYFGFNAGGADGVIGQRTRTAVSSYQAMLGYPVTGQITQYERDFLMSSYYRAQAGGPTTAELIASNPQGVRGLLLVYRDEQMNGGGTLASASIGGHYGLPRDVAAAVNEIAKSSDPTAEQLVQRSGFIQLSDINGDGRTDYIIDTSVTGSAFWCNAQSCAVRVFASTPEGYQRNDFQAFNVTPAMFSCTRGTCTKTDGGTQLATAQMLPQQPQTQPAAPQTQMASVVSTPVPSATPVVQGGAAVVATAPVIPNFFGDAAPAASLESHCNKVSLLTSTNGGFIRAETLTDPEMALSEQMCLTRTYAIASGEDLMVKVSAPASQIAEQCAGFGALLKEHVAALSLQPREDVMRGVSGFVLGSGMSPAQLESTAQICLASGYKTDDMDTAIGSALLLVALGKAPYAELLGHHLSQGFGTTERPDLAMAWYGHALDALDNGAAAVFTPGQPERRELLRKAALMLTGNAGVTNDAAGVVTQAASIPLFQISE